MIILDIETSGLALNCGIWQIGAINISSQNYFLEEAKIDEEDSVEEGALKVTGKNEEQLRYPGKQTQKKMIINYLDWVGEQREKLFFGQNVGWDITLIQNKTIKYGLHKEFLEIHGQRGNDLHSLVQEKYFEIYGKYLLGKTGKSDFNLGKVSYFCGIPDERINVRGSEVVKEGKIHNALDDCRLEGEILYRLKFGKNLFDEFKRFEIPGYLKK